MLVRTTIFFITKITFSSSWFPIIVVIIIAIVGIVALVVLINTIIPPKLTIRKILNISSIVVIVCHNRRSKFGRKFFKDCSKSKQCKFQLKDFAACFLSSGNKLVFAYITNFYGLLTQLQLD